MRSSIEEILNELGWDSGFRIPVANEENRRLEEEIDRKTKQKVNLVQELEVTEDRVKSIEQYVANIKIEHGYNQKLLTAYAAQFEAEEHLQKISQNEDSSLSQEIRDLEKEKKTIIDRIILITKEMDKLTDKLNFYKESVALDKTKLLEREEVLNRGEEDEQMIQKFMKLDGKKFKELELKRQKLTSDLEFHKRGIFHVIDEICEMEIMLDRTTKFYIQALEERRQLIDRWNQSLLVLRQRDNGIQETIREIETLKEIGNEKMDVLNESEQFMENQLNNNRHLEYLIKQTEKKLFFEKGERRKIHENMVLFESEFQMRKKALEEFSRKIQRLKTDIKNTKNDISSKRQKVDEWNKKIQELKMTLGDIGNQSLSVGGRIKQLESMIEKEEKRKLIIIKETKRLQDLILRTSARITDLENEKKIVELQKQGEIKKIEIFAVCRVKEEKRLKEKQDMKHQLDIEIQKCEMGSGRMGNDGSDKNELERKQKIILDLQKKLDERNDIAKLLQTHIVNLENDVRKLQNCLNSDNEELSRLKNKKQDLELMMEGGEKHLKAAQRMNEEKQVAENILELRVTQAEQMMKNIGDKLYNLEKYRLQVEAAMKERMVEINVQKEALNLEKRLALAECSEIRASIIERHARTQHLQSRYDNIIAALGTVETDGSPITTTFLKVQNAQEKYALQEEGDKLDATIRRTEHEIRSMENTLRIVNACNEKYRVSLNPTDDDSQGILENKQLDEEMLNALEQLRIKKNRLQEVEEELQKMQFDRETLMEDLHRIKDEKELKNRDVADLEKQITDQKEKLVRADKSLRKLYKDIQRMCENSHDDTILLQEKDIATRELQEQNRLALHRITEFTIRHVEAEVYVKKLLGAKNIVLPCAQHLKPSPSPSLCGSSRSSLVSSSRSRYPSTRESISRIQNLQPEFVFQVIGGPNLSRKNTETPTSHQSTQRSSTWKK